MATVERISAPSVLLGDLARNMVQEGRCCCLPIRFERSIAFGCVIAALGFFVTGCGKAAQPWERTYKVSGKITLDGKPTPGARVSLLPKDSAIPGTVRPIGTVDQDGNFVLETYQPKDGAPAGEYNVAVVWFKIQDSGSSGPNVIPPQYARPDSSGLVVTVPPTNGHQLDPISLTSKKVGAKSKNTALR